MLKPEHREAIYRLALQQQYADLSDYLDSITVPEGWQVVPVEPTREMLSATSWPSCAATDYKHMLAAAPKPGDSNE